MAAAEDLRLALAALRKKLLTREQLSAYLGDPGEEESPTPLARRLQQDGVLTAEQVEALRRDPAVLAANGEGATVVAEGLPVGGGGSVEYRQKIGEYALLGVLGRGGMGVVYAAQHDQLRRKVALKVLPPAIARDDHSRERFLREVRAAARLHHPGIVPVYDFGRDGDTYYYAMEFIEGPTLEEELRKGPLDPMRAARLLRQAADALHSAHAEGIVHRDIKPSNLILGADDQVHLTDFGIAREIAEVAITASGSMMGTPYYMSPEQASGTHGPPDARSDVYALGATLYEALTGRKPFEAPSFELILAMVLLAEPTPPRQHRNEIPRDLETVTLKAMAKEPGLRYATAQAFAEELGRVTRGEPIAARPVTRLERLARRLRAHRGVLAASALCALSVSAVAGKMTIEMSIERKQLEEEREVAAARARARTEEEERLRRRDELRNRARSLLREAGLLRPQSFAEALRVYAQAVDLDPTFHEPLFERAQAFRDEGRYDEALRDLAEALRRVPDCAEAYAERALLHLWRHDAAQAAADVDRLVRVRPDHPFAILARGALPFLAGRLDLAVKEFEAALRADPGNSLGWACLGGCLMEAGREEEGQRALERALQLDARNFMALANRAAYHLRHRRYEEALRDAGKAIEIAPGMPMSYLTRGSALLGLGKLDAAREDLERAVKRLPVDGEAYLTRARLRYRVGEFASAAADAATSARLRWSVREAHTLRGMALAWAGDPLGALEAAEALAQEEAGGASGGKAAAGGATGGAPAACPDAVAVRGAAYFASGEIDRAASLLDEFLDKRPDAALAQFVRGRVYLAEKNWGRAFRAFMTAIRVDPDLANEAAPEISKARKGMEEAASED